jgi:iron(III) transport system substrate-binding protein
MLHVRTCLAIVLVGLWAGGCAPAAPSAGAPPSTGGATAPAASDPGAAARAEWDRIVAAAKQEGRIVVLGPIGNEPREGLTLGFQRKYPEIAVEYVSSTGPQAAPRLINEFSAGQHITDLVIQGTTTMIGSLIPVGAVEPIGPYLVGPESRDQSRWKGGKFDFADEAEQYNLVFVGRVQIPFVYHPGVVTAGTFRSWKDLLAPQWKGKIAMLDPRQAGAGLDNATFWYTREGLGTEYIQQLFGQQDITVGREDRQILDWVARTQYPVAIGPNGVTAYEMKNRGLPVEIYSGEALQEGSFLSASNGSVTVATQPPHPNAVKVYLDWLLSQDGQTAWSQAAGVPSRRRDVSHDHLPEFLVPKEGVPYQENYKERYVKLREQVTEIIRPLIRS